MFLNVVCSHLEPAATQKGQEENQRGRVGVMTTVVEGQGAAGAASLGSCPTPLLWSQVSSSSFRFPGSVSLGQVKPHSFNNEFIKPFIYAKSFISLIFTVIQVFICVPPEADPEIMIQGQRVIPGNTREWEVKKGRQPIKECIIKQVTTVGTRA